MSKEQSHDKEKATRKGCFSEEKAEHKTRTKTHKFHAQSFLAKG